MQSQLADERQQQLLRMAQRHDVVHVREAAEELGVHEMTIRRDLNELAKRGLLERVHGGATLPKQASVEISFSLRSQERRVEKERISRLALRYVQKGHTVALDASTTSLALAEKLSSQAITVIVTNLESANVLARRDIKFFLVGGEFHALSRSFVGGAATALLERFRPDIAFFSAKGFSLEAGFSDAYLPEASLKERLVVNARRVVALIDHSKFGEEALYSFARLSDIDQMVTDRPPKQAIVRALKAEGVELVIAEKV